MCKLYLQRFKRFFVTNIFMYLLFFLTVVVLLCLFLKCYIRMSTQNIIKVALFMFILFVIMIIPTPEQKCYLCGVSIPRHRTLCDNCCQQIKDTLYRSIGYFEDD